MSSPVCTIVAGPNGAGKTTFALSYLPDIGCRNFVNAESCPTPIFLDDENGRAVKNTKRYDALLKGLKND